MGEMELILNQIISNQKIYELANSTITARAFTRVMCYADYICICIRRTSNNSATLFNILHSRKIVNIISYIGKNAISE